MEQAAKVKIEKQLKNIELQKEKKKLVSTEQIEKILTDIFVAFRTKILSIPSRCASTVVSLSSEIEVEEFLRNVLMEALEELSNWENEKPSKSD